ncbi:uncharacterized protein LOC144295922 [Canis aureus]
MWSPATKYTSSCTRSRLYIQLRSQRHADNNSVLDNRTTNCADVLPHPMSHCQQLLWSLVTHIRDMNDVLWRILFPVANREFNTSGMLQDIFKSGKGVKKKKIQPTLNNGRNLVWNSTRNENFKTSWEDSTYQSSFWQYHKINLSIRGNFYYV